MVLKVFVDSDVVISSLISSTGAAYLLINNTKLDLFVSDISQKELETVAKRLQINKKKLRSLLKNRFKLVELKKKYGNYVLDENDAHVIAGAKEAKARFLVSYNIKHFRTDKIKKDFNILILPPA